MKVAPFHVVHRKALPGGYVILRLSGEALECEPGQFVMLRGDWGFSPLLPRPFSLALVEGPDLTILVKVIGEGSKRLAAAQRGDVVLVHGPLGTSFRRVAPDERVLMVGGGVGIAPLLYLAQASRSAAGGGLVGVYGGRSRRDLPMAAELAAAAESVTFVTEDGTAGEKGLASRAMVEHLARTPFDRVVTCGPWAMMATVARLAAEAGLPCEVSLEAMMACGYGICLGCALPATDGGYVYACTDGPVIDAGRIVWGDQPEPSLGTEAGKDRKKREGSGTPADKKGGKRT
ncbi:MAG: dihydroorotate dehydrogenase electron transfer subunit [Deltaproteobacteria bacterium]|nr:dihydroorotate dehydrogenase electron transfer subunit [Deltaproteobacteria bacterium]